MSDNKVKVSKEIEEEIKVLDYSAEQAFLLKQEEDEKGAKANDKDK